LCATDLLGVFDPGSWGVLSRYWGVCCPRNGPFLWPEQLSAPVPATLDVLFVDGKDEEAMIAKVASKFLPATFCIIIVN
jgi:hypothetical protein